MFKDDPLAGYFAQGGQVGFRLQNPEAVPEVPSVLTEIPEGPTVTAPPVPSGPGAGLGDVTYTNGVPDWWNPAWGSYENQVRLGLIDHNAAYDSTSDSNYKPFLDPYRGYQGGPGVVPASYGVPTQQSQTADTSALYDPKKIALGGGR